jgi:hypothetical protein
MKPLNRMKNLFAILLIALSVSALAQTTDATLTTQAQQIKNETTAGANTANRVGTHLQNLVYSKKSFFTDGTASGTDTYSVTLDNGAVTSLTSQWFVIKFTNGNTGAATLNINAIGAKALRKTDGSALSAGDIAAGSVHLLSYDGTNLQMLSLGGGGSSGTSDFFLPSSIYTAGSDSTWQQPYLIHSGGTTPGIVEYGHLGNILGTTEDIIGTNVFVGNVSGRGVLARNIRWNGTKYVTPDQDATAYGTTLGEAGGEGFSLHQSPSGVDFGDVDHLLFLATAVGPRKWPGVTTGYYNQSLNTLLLRWDDDLTANNDSWNSNVANPLIYMVAEKLKGTAGTDTQGEFMRAQVNSSTSTAYPSNTFQTSSGTSASPTNVSAGRTIGELAFHAYGGAYRKTAAIRAEASGTVNGSGAGQSLLFLTSPNTVSNLTERLRITETGAWELEGVGGTDGQVPTIQSDGTMAFETPSGGGGGGSAEGATGNVQYKSNGGGFQAEAAFTYDSANNTLTVPSITRGSATSLTDGAAITITGSKHTLSSTEAAVTWTLSQTGDYQTTDVILNATSTTWTFPAGALCVVNGAASGNNVATVTGVSGDHHVMSIYKNGTDYRVVIKNFGQ